MTSPLHAVLYQQCEQLCVRAIRYSCLVAVFGSLSVCSRHCWISVDRRLTCYADNDINVLVTLKLSMMYACTWSYLMFLLFVLQ